MFSLNLNVYEINIDRYLIIQLDLGDFDFIT